VSVKLFLYVVVGFAFTGLTFWWIIAAPAPVSSPPVFFLFAVVCTISNIGSFWMLYMAIRYEKNPWPTVLLAFIPFTSFWYYFERVRPGKLKRPIYPD